MTHSINMDFLLKHKYEDSISQEKTSFFYRWLHGNTFATSQNVVNEEYAGTDTYCGCPIDVTSGGKYKAGFGILHSENKEQRTDLLIALIAG